MKTFISILFLLSVVACQQQSEKAPVPVTSKGTNISYTDCGKADTTLLFVHGWCINKEYWDLQVKHFCPRYRVVAIDLPGFGQSGKNRNSWEFGNYTDDIRAVIDQLKLKNVVLIGHSMSGDIVLDADNKFPDLLAGIVGIDNLHEPGGPASAEQQAQSNKFFEFLSAHYDSAVNTMQGMVFLPIADTQIVKRVMDDVHHADSTISTAVLRSLNDVSQLEKQKMQKLSHTLYLVNTDMYPIKGDSLQKYCARSYHLEIVKAKSHYPMIEVPADFNEALQRTIDLIGK